ncbi:discoidin domain-containing protein [Candidatus Bathyarchaeota archaeon]|nr:discoidin domain-containing protein [Candidatus Bathyarchaeota archaeon]
MPFKMGGEIPMGRVKLPEPLTSDYLIPSTVVARKEFTNFEDGLGGWSLTKDTNVIIAGLSDVAISGSRSFMMQGKSGVTIPYAGYVGATLYKTIDLTYITKLSFKYRMVTSGNYARLSVKVDDTEVWGVDSESASTSTTTITIDLSSYTGVHSIKFEYIFRTGDATAVWFNIDDISLTNNNPASNAIDNNPSTFFVPLTADAGEWIYIDLRTPTIVGGARIYWGSNVPNAYRIQASLDATNWTDVYQATSPPATNDWTEYSWYATYARYLRIYIDDSGGVAPEIGEFHYYSLLIGRVAAEHGHGSGVEKWKKGTGVRRGFKVKELLNEKIKGKKKKQHLSKDDIIELIEEILNYIEFQIND